MQSLFVSVYLSDFSDAEIRNVIFNMANDRKLFQLGVISPDLLDKAFAVHCISRSMLKEQKIGRAGDVSEFSLREFEKFFAVLVRFSHQAVGSFVSSICLMIIDMFGA